jgi:hypothetical protein
MDSCDLLWPLGLREFVTLHAWNPLKWNFLKSQIFRHISPGNQRPRSTLAFGSSMISLSLYPQNFRSTFTQELWIFCHLSLQMMDDPWPLWDFNKSSLLCAHRYLNIMRIFIVLPIRNDLAPSWMGLSRWLMKPSELRFPWIFLPHYLSWDLSLEPFDSSKSYFDT